MASLPAGAADTSVRAGACTKTLHGAGRRRPGSKRRPHAPRRAAADYVTAKMVWWLTCGWKSVGEGPVWAPARAAKAAGK